MTYCNHQDCRCPRPHPATPYDSAIEQVSESAVHGQNLRHLGRAYQVGYFDGQDAPRTTAPGKAELTMPEDAPQECCPCITCREAQIPTCTHCGKPTGITAQEESEHDDWRLWLGNKDGTYDALPVQDLYLRANG